MFIKSFRYSECGGEIRIHCNCDNEYRVPTHKVYAKCPVCKHPAYIPLLRFTSAISGASLIEDAPEVEDAPEEPELNHYATY